MLYPQRKFNSRNGQFQPEIISSSINSTVSFTIKTFTVYINYINHVLTIEISASQKRPLLMTLYNDFQTNEGASIIARKEPHVVLALRLKVTTKNCKFY